MSQEERLMILQMVADKKISAQEAAELLRVIDNKESEAPEPGPESESHRRGPRLQPPLSVPTLLSGLGSFIETMVERIGTAFNDVTEPTYEFPQELTGEFTGAEAPLRILTGSGRAQVIGWDQPGYKATIMVKAGGATEEDARRRATDAFRVSTEQGGFEFEARRNDFHDMTVHVVLLVPREKLYRLEIRTGNGRVELDGLRLTEARTTSGNGRLSLKGIAADRVVIRSGNGAIEVEGDVADLDASSGNGSITARPEGRRSQSLRLTTGNGSIKVERQRLPEGVGLKLDCHTGMGGVKLGVPDMLYDRDVRSMAHKHVIARTPGFEEALVPVTIVARTGMGSVTLD